MRPCRELNRIILGTIGRALMLYPGILLHALVAVSNHIELILTTCDGETLARFMCFVNSNIAREAGRLCGWREKFWGRRYRDIQILDDEALVTRLRYLLAHGCKEGMVQRPEDWPGVTCLSALLRGEALRGVWYSRTEENRARRRGETPLPDLFARTYDVTLAPLPCWAHLYLCPEEQRAKVAELVESIEAEVREKNLAEGRIPPGSEWVCRQDPHSKPRHVKRSPAPDCHASTQEARVIHREAYQSFLAVYRKASEALRAGRAKPAFPANCFPPASAFIGEPVALPP